jgi:hypothetical protein
MGEFKSPSEKQSAKATPAKKSQDSSNVGEAEFLDSRSSTFQLKKFQEAAQDNGRGSGLSQLQNKSSNHTGTSRIAQLQRMSDERNVSEQSAFIQENENKTGIPDGLKSGMESVSGISLNDVTVHRNSNKPAQLQAHAYAQGTDIHLGPGQEKHLPHEAWHVVQQKQGRVQATTQGNGNVPINDNPSLEREATQMGQKALKESSSGGSKLKNATVSSNATAQLITKEEEISLKTARPLTKGMKATVGNQMKVNDQIRGFDKSKLRKTAAPAAAVAPAAAPAAKSPVAAVGPAAPTKAAVTRSTDELSDISAIPGISSVLKGVSSSQAETDKHGNASLMQKGANVAKSTAALGGAKAVEGAIDVKKKGSGILGGIKSGMSKAWGGLKSMFGGGPKEEAKAPKAPHPDEPSTMSKVLNTGKNVLGSAAIEGTAAFAKGTIGKVGDVGAEGVKAVQSGIAAKEAHGLLKGREEDMKGKEGADRDLGTSLSRAVRNQHAGQAVVSGAKVVKGVGGVVKTAVTGGLDGLVESGAEMVGNAASSAMTAAKKGAVSGLMGDPSKPALSKRDDLTLGESLAGQSKTEKENLANFQAKIAGKGELSEEDMKAASKSRAALIQEAADRAAGHGKLKKANLAHNKAQSMDTSKMGDKYDLERESIQHNKSAEEHREGVDSGANTLSPSDFKARGKDLRTLKKVGADLQASDASFTEGLGQNEEKSHNRFATASERIDGLKDEAYKKLRS